MILLYILAWLSAGIATTLFVYGKYVRVPIFNSIGIIVAGPIALVIWIFAQTFFWFVMHSDKTFENPLIKKITVPYNLGIVPHSLGPVPHKSIEEKVMNDIVNPSNPCVRTPKAYKAYMAIGSAEQTKENPVNIHIIEGAPVPGLNSEVICQHMTIFTQRDEGVKYITCPKCGNAIAKQMPTIKDRPRYGRPVFPTRSVDNIPTKKLEDIRFDETQFAIKEYGELIEKERREMRRKRRRRSNKYRTKSIQKSHDKHNVM